MNSKRVKRLRKILKERGTPATHVEFAEKALGDKTVTLKGGCGRSMYKKVKRSYKRFGL